MSYFPASSLAIAPSQITGSTPFGRALIILDGSGASNSALFASTSVPTLIGGQAIVEAILGGGGPSVYSGTLAPPLSIGVQFGIIQSGS